MPGAASRSAVGDGAAGGPAGGSFSFSSFSLNHKLFFLLLLIYLQVQFSMGQAHFELPQIDTSDVMGVTMNFTALETDFAGEDELVVNYKGKTVT